MADKVIGLNNVKLDTMSTNNAHALLKLKNVSGPLKELLKQKVKGAKNKVKAKAKGAYNKVNKLNWMVKLGIFIVIWFLAGLFIQLWGCNDNNKDDEGKCPSVDINKILWTIASAFIAAGLMWVFVWMGSRTN